MLQLSSRFQNEYVCFCFDFVQGIVGACLFSSLLSLKFLISATNSNLLVHKSNWSQWFVIWLFGFISTISISSPVRLVFERVTQSFDRFQFVELWMHVIKTACFQWSFDRQLLICVCEARSHWLYLLLGIDLQFEEWNLYYNTSIIIITSMNGSKMYVLCDIYRLLYVPT